MNRILPIIISELLSLFIACIMLVCLQKHSLIPSDKYELVDQASRMSNPTPVLYPSSPFGLSCTPSMNLYPDV